MAQLFRQCEEVDIQRSDRHMAGLIGHTQGLRLIMQRWNSQDKARQWIEVHGEMGIGKDTARVGGVGEDWKKSVSRCCDNWCLSSSVWVLAASHWRDRPRNIGIEHASRNFGIVCRSVDCVGREG